MSVIRGLYIDPPLVVPAIWGLSTGFVCLAVGGSSVAERRAMKESGPSKPLTRRNAGVIAVNTLFGVLPHVYLLFTIPFNGWRMPRWMARFSFSRPPAGELADWRNAGFALATAGAALYAWSLYTLAKAGSFGGFESRQRGRMVDSGPYSVVRHPIYTGVLLMPLGYSLAFWNGAPLFVFAGLAASLVYKLPIEEKMLEQGSVGDAYGHYRFRVRHRLIPYVY